MRLPYLTHGEPYIKDGVSSHSTELCLAWLSPDQKSGRAGSREGRSTTKGSSRSARSQGLSSKKLLAASNRDSSRCQRALEKQFAKTQRASLGEAEISIPLQSEPSPQPRERQDWSPDGISEPPVLALKRIVLHLPAYQPQVET